MKKFSVLALVSVSAFAAEKPIHSHSKHKSHKAHDHGVARLDIAADDVVITLQLNSPAMNIMGFEHVAKSESDKKKMTSALETFQTKANEIFIFNSKLECKSEKVTADVDSKEGEHRDVDATFVFRCKSPPLGTLVKVNFGKFFPSMKKIHVQYVSNLVQTSKVLIKGTGVVGL